MIEILAPVGAKMQLIAAVRSGADAVYLGTKNFNARKNADNFDNDELIDAVKYCHERGVRVYVALNTVITDNEIDLAVKTVKDIANAGADGIIVQDLAIYRIIKDTVPDMPIHASTQMSIHNALGVKALEKLGFCRVVPARELSLDELKTIRKSCDIELEVFVHGALCMCVSGQCYLSSILGQRSANRGLCAQPCRLNFSSQNGEYALSLKDLSIIDNLNELEKAGINSAKIEGRMKRPEYVAAATSACKSAANGQGYNKDELRAVFSRSGFTDGYLKGKRERDMFGFRTKDDVVSAAPILKKIANEYRNEMPLVAVDFYADIKKDKNISLTVCDGKNSVSVTGEIPQIAQNKPTEKEGVIKSLSKCGGTPFFANKVEVDIDDGLFLPLSAINELRKSAIDALLKIRGKSKAYKVYDFKRQIVKNTAPKYQRIIIRVKNKEQICDGADKIIADIDLLYQNPELCKKYKDKLVCELDTLLFAEGKIKDKLLALKELGIDTVYAPNLYAIELAKQCGFKIFGGFSLNINNSIALDEYKKLGVECALVSFECSLERFDALHRIIPCGVIGYGKMPLMTFRACPVKSNEGCKNCDGRQTITDRMGNKMTVFCNKKQYSQLLNPIPIYMGDKRMQLKNADFITLYFTDESESECKKVMECFLKSKPFYDKFTRGLYYKEIK